MGQLFKHWLSNKKDGQYAFITLLVCTCIMLERPVVVKWQVSKNPWNSVFCTLQRVIIT